MNGATRSFSEPGWGGKLQLPSASVAQKLALRKNSLSAARLKKSKTFR
jgi:hypothetical protein